MRSRIVPSPIATDETATMTPPADFIIVGAGSAGCVMARVLAERGFGVILVEAGPDSPVGRAPASYLKSFGSGEDWAFETIPQAGLAQRKLSWPRGRGPGGSTRINAMIWYPPQPQDLAQIALAGGARWSSDSLSTHLPQLHEWVRPEPPRWISETTRRFLLAAAERDLSFHAFTRMTCQGRRRTAFDLVAESRSHSRIQSVTASVLRIRFEASRATGVELLPEGGQQPLTIRADIAVILSAGAIGSPTLLMHSGIGPGDVLDEIHVDPVQVIEQVGLNLSDHLIMPIIFATPPQHRFPVAPNGHHLARFQIAGTGPLASNLAEAGGVFRLPGSSTREALKSDRSDQVATARPTSRWAQIHVTPTHYLLHPDPRAPAAMTIGVNLCDPHSRGRLRLRPSTDRRPAAVQIDPAYLSDAGDIGPMLLAIGFVRELAEQSSLKSFCRQELLPGLSRDTDEALIRCVARYAQTLYHPVGTCRMGRDCASVVDERLAVRGITGLHIVDGSVLPGIPSVNPNATVMMLARHAAEMIAESSA